ncbi:MAG: hypothetical protein AVDCRST_MAG89-1904, partial [uncultured Gemmatimonadetes bacterium]
GRAPRPPRGVARAAWKAASRIRPERLPAVGRRWCRFASWSVGPSLPFPSACSARGVRGAQTGV